MACMESSKMVRYEFHKWLIIAFLILGGSQKVAICKSLKSMFTLWNSKNIAYNERDFIYISKKLPIKSVIRLFIEMSKSEFHWFSSQWQFLDKDIALPNVFWQNPLFALLLQLIDHHIHGRNNPATNSSLAECQKEWHLWIVNGSRLERDTYQF